MNILIIGYGDIGRRVARLELKNGSDVMALARNPAPMEGVRFIRADLDHPSTLTDLSTDEGLVYYFAPPPPRGAEDSRMRNWLKRLTSGSLPRKMVYISTTGVYGDRRGGWVDEATPPNPRTDRARRRLDAERRLTRWSEEHGIPVVILRVGGIYSRERLPVERIRQHRPVLRPEEAPFSNRIHADDLALVCVTASHHRNTDAGVTIYNVTDGQQSTMTDYFHAAADALGLPRCPEITRAEAEQRLSPAMLSYLNESRRVDNHKMLRELGIRLRYPNLASGLTVGHHDGHTASPLRSPDKSNP